MAGECRGCGNLEQGKLNERGCDESRNSWEKCLEILIDVPRDGMCYGSDEADDLFITAWEKCIFFSMSLSVC